MNIAILGFGTVGTGVYDIIKNSNTPFEIVKVFDLRKELKDKLNNIYTDNIEDIINDINIDTVVECLGGLDFPYSITKRLLESKKNVVTSNKEVVSAHFSELLKIARNNNVLYLFEASCGGGIPNLYEIARLSRYDSIKSIRGILNGTTNYILSKMNNENISFSDALKEAQDLGFAEKDPTNDIMGYDILRKALILYYLSYNKEFDKDKIELIPLTEDNISKNKTIKYIATIDEFNISIKPTEVLNNDIFKNLDGAFNAVEVNTKFNDTLVFIGKGAGKYPTASSIIKDLFDVYNKNNYIKHIDL